MDEPDLKQKRKQINVLLNDKAAEQLEILSERQNLPKSTILKLALAEYFARTATAADVSPYAPKK